MGFCRAMPGYFFVFEFDMTDIASTDSPSTKKSMRDFVGAMTTRSKVMGAVILVGTFALVLSLIDKEPAPAPITPAPTANQPVASADSQKAADLQLTESVKASAINVTTLLQQRYGLSVSSQTVAEICGAPTGDNNEWIRDCLLKIADMRLSIIKAIVEAEKRALGRIP